LKQFIYHYDYRYYAPAPREEGNKRCFCPSVCPSIAYIANNLRTQRPSVPIFGMKVPHLRCDSHTSFKIKRSKVRVGGRRCIPCWPILAATLLVIIIGRNICNAVKVNWSYWKSLGCSIRGCTERKANFYMAFESTLAHPLGDLMK